MYHIDTGRADPIPFHRPIRWDRLRSDEAQRVIRKWAADTGNVIIGVHAFDRIDERSILQTDVYRILRTGHVEGNPTRNEKGEWEVVVVQRMQGTREAGVVTIILRAQAKLFVKTVMWMDYER